ncbi:MAG: AMP-binding protein, partial [Albidovulum sp.]
MANHLYDALFERYEGSPSDFLILPDGSRISHGEFNAMAARHAGALAEAGLEPGDRVALQLEKSPDMLAVIAGAIRAGMVFLPLNTAYTPAEVSYFVADAGAKLLLCDGRSESALAQVARSAGARLATLNADGTGSFAAATRGAAPRAGAARGAGDLAALLDNNGTTGRWEGAIMCPANHL